MGGFFTEKDVGAWKVVYPGPRLGSRRPNIRDAAYLICYGLFLCVGFLIILSDLCPFRDFV